MDPPQLTTDDFFPPTKWAGSQSRAGFSVERVVEAVPFFTVAQDMAGEVLKWETTRGVL